MSFLRRLFGLQPSTRTPEASIRSVLPSPQEAALTSNESIAKDQDRKFREGMEKLGALLRKGQRVIDMEDFQWDGRIPRERYEVEIRRAGWDFRFQPGGPANDAFYVFFPAGSKES